MMQYDVQPHLAVLEFQAFTLHTLVIESEVLKQNPLGDPSRRHCPVLVPRGPAPQDGWPVVLMLSGLSSNGPQSFNLKSYEQPTPSVLDAACVRGEAPRACYVFCDATTFWGGSQFIDSEGQGRYGTFIAHELHQAILSSELFSASKRSQRWCVMGGSSGGYGALQLGSRHPDKFGYVIALAPDSFFEASALPELRTALPILNRMGGLKKLKEDLVSGRLMKRKEWHTLVNIAVMGLSYAPLKNGEPVWPIDLDTGRVIPEVWKEWLRHDPLDFLRSRLTALLSVNAFYLDAGDRDQFQLQYGTRQIRNLLSEAGANVEYAGFEGTHFDLGERRRPAWVWLQSHWRT